MRIVLSDSPEAAVQTVVTAVLDKISQRPTAVVGLATGNTMLPVYAAWVEAGRKLDHSKCFFFTLDEYLGLTSNHPSSFKSYVQRHLRRPLGLREDQFAYPPADAADHALAALNYERVLRESGGVDLQLLGIGTNGHIGFNEPGSTADSRTRVIRLSEETRANNAASVAGEMPQEALTMGIGTILESKSIVLLATGPSKANVIKYLVNHHDDENCPATFLKSHPHFTLVLDPAAASRINLKI